MKTHHFAIFIATHLLCISTSLFTMHQGKERRITTVAMFDNNSTAVGTNQDCVFVTNCQEDSKKHERKILHKYPTHNIIADKKNMRLGVFSKNLFIVYDVHTGDRIWSKLTYSTNCSAAFYPPDGTIFLCDNDYLYDNKNISIQLPYTGTSDCFGIECHSIRKEVLYPCSNTTLAIYSFESKQYERHSLNIDQSSIILRALYSPEKNYIAALTNKGKIFIYNPTNKTTIHTHENLDHYYGCSNPVFIPQSTILAFLSNNTKDIHYWNVHNMQEILKEVNKGPFPSANDNALINKFNFSRDGSYVVSAEIMIARLFSIPKEVKDFVIHQKLFSYYCLLKSYTDKNKNFLPSDIINLIVQCLHILLNTQKN